VYDFEGKNDFGAQDLGLLKHFIWTAILLFQELTRKILCTLHSTLAGSDEEIIFDVYQNVTSF
jgi:hypothetical protein